MHWHHYRTWQHDSLANFYVTYKTGWDYSQVLENDCLQDLVARAVPGTLRLEPAACCWPGLGHISGVVTEICVACTYSFGESFPVGITKSCGMHPDPPAMLPQYGHFFRGFSRFANKTMCHWAQTRRWPWFWFTSIVIASTYSSPCPMWVTGAALPDLLISAIFD